MDLDTGDRIRLRAGLISLVVAVVLLAVKYQAYRMTRSTAILSDALESIVNVVAAGFAVGALLFGGRPADRNHPYGHGKIEFLSAAFEGGLIFFAAFLILYEVAQSLIEGVELRDLDRGLLLVLGAGLVNLGLGLYLVRTGRAHHSIALVADGRHVLSDFWTSLGIVVGLGLVYLTGQSWLDPVVAALVAVQLMWTGLRLIRHAGGALLDEEDVGLLARLVEALRLQLGQGAIRVHHLRAIRSGRFHHIDVDLVVPEFWSVELAHELADRLAEKVLAEVGIEGELIVHTDPCHRAYCAMCDLADCPVRREPFRGRPPLTLQEACAQPRPSPAS
ncbi:MAG: cation diffusion facilitator family transporter [Candidatus Rokubacteria bacterium]|nr:cation diffusion facilitator family transporter [Candidatus Rokubacteria bacterium]